MPEVDLTRRVGYDTRVYSDAGSEHKMGWLREGDIVRLIEEYHGWYRIDPQISDAPDLFQPHDVDGEPAPPGSADYSEYWVEDRPDGLFLPLTDTSDTDEPDAPDIGPTDAEIGRVVRYLFGL